MQVRRSACRCWAVDDQATRKPWKRGLVWPAWRLGCTAQLTSSRQPGPSPPRNSSNLRHLSCHSNARPSPQPSHAASRSHLVTDSWVSCHIVCPVQSLLNPLLLLYWCCRWPGRIPRSLTGRTLNGFTRRSPSLISSFIIPFTLSFPSPTPISPPPGLSSISSSHHHTSALASSSLTVIYPPLERFIQPSFPLPCKTPHQNSIASIAMIFVMLAHAHQSQGTGSTGAHFSFSAQPVTQQSVWRAGIHREFSLPGQIWILLR